MVPWPSSLAPSAKPSETFRLTVIPYAICLGVRALIISGRLSAAATPAAPAPAATALPAIAALPLLMHF